MQRIRIKTRQFAARISDSRSSQNAWARRLRISRSYLSQLVKGQRVYPSELIRQRILSALDLSFAELFEVEGTEPTFPGSSRKPLLQFTIRGLQIRVARVPRSGSALKGNGMMRDLLLDLRYGLRGLLRDPSFAVVVVLTLALGIGAATAIFSVVDQALFRLPPGIGDAERLVTLYRGGDESPSGAISYPYYLDVKEQSSNLSDVAATFDSTVNIGTDSSTERVSARLVTTNYFAVLGAKVALGWPFGPEEEGRIVVLGHGLWQRWFGSRSDIIGEVVSLNRHSYTVVGIATSAFRGTTAANDPPQLWVPLIHIADFVPAMGSHPLRERHFSMFRLIGRLSPRSGIQSATAELESLAAKLEVQDPSSPEPRRFQAKSVTGRPAQAESGADYALILSGAVLIVLIIACANVVNLVLGRGLTRRAELAVRQALGAGRWMLVRLLLVESLVLFAVGGIAAVFVAGAILSMISISGLGFGPLTVDGRVLLLALGLTTLTGISSSVLPALQALDNDAVDAMKARSSTLLPGPMRFKNILVVGQVALSVLLLISAGLLLRIASEHLKAFDIVLVYYER